MGDAPTCVVFGDESFSRYGLHRRAYFFRTFYNAFEIHPMRRSETTATFPDFGGVYSYYFDFPLISNDGLLFVRVSTEFYSYYFDFPLTSNDGLLFVRVSTEFFLFPRENRFVAAVPLEQLHLYIFRLQYLVIFMWIPATDGGTVSCLGGGDDTASWLFDCEYSVSLWDEIAKRLREKFCRNLFLLRIRVSGLYRTATSDCILELDTFRGALFARLTTGEKPATEASVRFIFIYLF
jgi:hypothetical protein